MSMDLEKKTFSTAPKYFIAGAKVAIVSAVKKASAAVEAHSPVLLVDNEVTPLAAVSGDAAPVTTGLYGITADSAAAGEEAAIYLTGEFFADALVLPKGVTADKLEVPLRNIGIFLK